MSRELHMVRTIERGQALGSSDLAEYTSPGPPTVRGVPAGYQPVGPLFRHVGDDVWEPLVDELVDVVTNAVTSAMTARFRTT